MTPIELVQEILRLANEPGSAEDVRLCALIKQFRESLGLSATEFAAKLGVSVQTVYRWQSTNPPPLSEIYRMQTLVPRDDSAGPSLGATATSPPEPGIVRIGRKFLGVRQVDEILDLEALATEVWLLKSETEFIACEAGKPRSRMEQLIRSRVEAQQPLDFYFLYPQREAPDTSVAEQSFARFREYLGEKAPLLLDRVHGIPVPEEHQTALGLAKSYSPWIVLFYDDAENRRREDGRKYDVFVEVAASTYEHDAQLRRFEMMPLDPALIWIEQPQRHAKTLIEQWTAFFNSTRKTSQLGRQGAK